MGWVVMCRMRPGNHRFRMIIETDGIRHPGGKLIRTGHLHHPAHIVQLVLDGIVVQIYRGQWLAEPVVESNLRAIAITVAGLHDKLMHLVIEDIIFLKTLALRICRSSYARQIAIPIIPYIAYSRRAILQVLPDLGHITRLRIDRAFPLAVRDARSRYQ